MHERLGSEHYGEERAEAEETKAERIIVVSARKRAANSNFPKSPLGRVWRSVAVHFRRFNSSAMTVGWIAERFGVGTRGYLNHLLYRRRKLRPK